MIWDFWDYWCVSRPWWASIMGLFWLVMGHVFHMISYVDCDVDCDMDSYMPGGGGMLTTDIEASRWSNKYRWTIHIQTMDSICSITGGWSTIHIRLVHERVVTGKTGWKWLEMMALELRTLESLAALLLAINPPHTAEQHKKFSHWLQTVAQGQRNPEDQAVGNYRDSYETR